MSKRSSINQLTLDVDLLFSSTADLSNSKQTKKARGTWADMFLFIIIQLIGLTLKGMETKLHP